MDNISNLFEGPQGSLRQCCAFQSGRLRQRRMIRRRWRFAIQRLTHTIEAATAAPDIRVKIIRILADN
jgi:hypothetical protein